jgi:hypothetical protein
VKVLGIKRVLHSFHQKLQGGFKVVVVGDGDPHCGNPAILFGVNHVANYTIVANFGFPLEYVVS